ncbi:MAG: thiamine diphosphokinase [Lachnospiraceae bacterium]|nr:thiamine diphosphokinase [Candidatus Colinaster scatohippi]
MSTTLIINAGEFSPIPNDLKYDYVIACDGGYTNAVRLGIKPDLIIGDFDSYDGDPDKDFGEIPVHKYNVMKDDTDCMLAIKYAIRQGATKVILACSLGGRMDHLFANIQSMSYVASRGIACELVSATDYMKIITNETLSLPIEDGYSLSVFSLTNTCKGVTIKGALYSITNYTLENTFPLGLGNSWDSDQITISLKEGQLLVIKSKIQ